MDTLYKSPNCSSYLSTVFFSSVFSCFSSIFSCSSTCAWLSATFRLFKRTGSSPMTVSAVTLNSCAKAPPMVLAATEVTFFGRLIRTSFTGIPPAICLGSPPRAALCFKSSKSSLYSGSYLLSSACVRSYRIASFNPWRIFSAFP